MGARLACSCSQAECWTSDESTLRIDAEIFELSPDGQQWQKLDEKLAKIRVFNNFDESSSSQPRVVATSTAGQVLVDTLIPIGEKVHKVSDFFVYFRSETQQTIGFNTLCSRDTSLLISQTSNTTPFNMFQHSFTASVSRIATFEEDAIQENLEPSEVTNVSLNPLNMVFNYKNQPVTIDLLESFACSNLEDSVDITHANNIFRIMVSSHAHMFLIQALNVSSLLLARTSSPNVAINYLTRQNEKIQQKLIGLLENSESSDSPSKEDVRQMLLLKNVVVQQRICALQQTKLPGIELIQNDISSEILDKLLEKCQLSSLFLYHFNMNSFRIWRKPMDTYPPCSSSSTGIVHNIPIQQIPASSSSIIHSKCDDHITTHNGTTTFHASNLTAHSSPPPLPAPLPTTTTTTTTTTICNPSQPGPSSSTTTTIPRTNEPTQSQTGDEYHVRKTNGRLGLTIYAHNEDGVIRAEVRGVTSFAPRSAQVGDAVIAVDGEKIASVKNASDVERLLRHGKVIHLRRQRQQTLATTTSQTGGGGGGKLSMALQELLTTEKKYVADLREMNEVFLCVRAVRDIMHSSIRLLKIQIAFVDSLEEAIGDLSRTDISVAQIRDSVVRVCAVFVNKCADFKIYAEYASAYLRLQHELAHKKELAAKLEAINSTREQHASCESRMIKPVQRIVQYPLLLKNIGDALPRGDARERIQVETACQKMQTLAEYVNEMQRLHEEYAQYIEMVRKANEPMLTEKRCRVDTRDLLIFAHIKWRDAPADHYVIFVFHTVILLLPSYARKEIKMKWTRVLPINEVDIDEISQDPMNLKLYHAAFEGPNGQLSHSNPNTVYHIECCQPQLKTQLIRSIKKARANFNTRENHRPLSGSSQSDGGYVSEVSKETNNNNGRSTK